RGRPGARTPHGPDRAIPAYRVRPGRRTDPESRGRHAPHEPLPAIPTGIPGDVERRTTDDTRTVSRARAPCSASAGVSRVCASRGGRRIVAVETPRSPGDGTLTTRNGREETNDAARCADCRRSTDPARDPTHGIRALLRRACRHGRTGRRRTQIRSRARELLAVRIAARHRTRAHRLPGTQPAQLGVA